MRKRKEEALRDLSRVSQGVFDALTAHVCVLDENGRILAVNRAWREFAAANPPPAVGADVGANYFAVCAAATGDDAAIARDALRGLRAVGSGEMREFSCQYPCHSPDTQRWFMLRATRLSATGSARLVVAHENITERTLAEIGLRESEQRYRTVADFTWDWETWVRPDGRFVYVSPSCERITGYRAGEFLADPTLFERIVHPDDRGHVARHCRQASEAPAQRIMFRVIGRGGDERWVEHACQPVHAASGECLGRRGSNRDMTEHRNVERQLRESRERLTSLSRRLVELQETERRTLAQELHDRVGQNLTALGLALNMTRGLLGSGAAEPVAAQLDDSLRLVAETMDLIRDVTAELRPSVLDEFGLVAALQWFGGQFAQRTGLRVRVAAERTTGRLPAAVETALFRIAQEALTNVAKHAQAHEVVVTLDTADDGLRMAVADDGVGFDPATHGPSSAPSRWGLATMRERAAAVGAHWRAESAPGRGTTVVVIVPRAEDPWTDRPTGL